MNATLITIITPYLASRAEDLLRFRNPNIPRHCLHLPGLDAVRSLYPSSDRNSRVLVGHHRIFAQGRLANPGYLSVASVDQGASILPAPAPHQNPITSTQKHRQAGHRKTF